MLSKRFRNEMYESVLQINHFKSDDAHQEDQSTCISNRVFSSQFEYIFFSLSLLAWLASILDNRCLPFGRMLDRLRHMRRHVADHFSWAIFAYASQQFRSVATRAQAPSRWFMSKTRRNKKNDRHYIKKEVFLHRVRKSPNPCPTLTRGLLPCELGRSITVLWK